MELLTKYAMSHGASVDSFVQAGWQETQHNNKPALSYPTQGGTRYRMLAGEQKYVAPGYKQCWYRLNEALELVKQTGYLLVICNGEASTIAAQARGIPATCIPGGEKHKLPEQLVDELKAQYTHPIIVAFDCDETGRRASEGVTAQLHANGIHTIRIAFDAHEAKPQGYDLADWVRDNATAEDINAELQRYTAMPSVQENETEQEQVKANPDLNTAIAQIAERFPWIEYAEEHFGPAQKEQNGEFRIFHNGGLFVNPSKGVWHRFLYGDGGNVITFVQLAQNGQMYERKNKRQWGTALREAAKITGVTLPERKAASKATTFSTHFTDAGNAENFAMLFGNIVRYNHTAEKWLIWDGVRWAVDNINQVDQFAVGTARAMLRTSSDIDDMDKRKAAVGWALSTENLQRRKAMLVTAQSAPELATTANVFDTHALLVAAENGTIDLKTGTLRESAKDDYLTKQLGTRLDKNAKCPQWEQFIYEIFDHNQELIDYVQRCIGYSLTGDTREQCLFLLHGNGSNGKSTFLETIALLMGEYADTAAFASFDAGSRSEQTNDLAKLRGARFVTIIEANEDRRLNEAKVKSVTGQDTITCRFLHQEFFSYRPQFKIWLAMNHKPIIIGQDNGIWRRIKLIPFKQNFEGREDKTLDAKLRAELPGILNWALEGLQQWLQGGLKEPKTVRDAVTQYRTDSDIIQQWLDECCEFDNRTDTPGDTLYMAYTAWAEMRNDKVITRMSWSRRMTDKGYETEPKKLGGKTVRVYKGIKADITIFGKK